MAGEGTSLILRARIQGAIIAALFALIFSDSANSQYIALLEDI